MTDIVQDTLKKMGPCITSELVAALVSDYGLTSVNARQKVSRSTSIKKLAYLPFPRNARFAYLQTDYASPSFWDALTRDLLKHTISYGGGLAALLARGGVMPVAHFAIACGAPIAQKGHLSPATILDRLKTAGLVQTFEVPGIGECVELSQKAAAQSYELAEMRARLRTEEILLCAIKDWARNLGLVSYHKVALRDEDGRQPKVGTFNWDLSAPSYLGPLRQWASDKPSPGFVVCDVLLGVNVSAKELQPFINKCKTLRSLKRVGRCLQFFVADGYEPDALFLAKSEGIIPATTSNLFGLEVAKALRELTDLLSNVYPYAETIEMVDEVFVRLSHIEGAATNLRGALFEYLVAEVVRCRSPHSSIQLNEILRDEQGRPAEVDVLVHHINQSVRFIECKGYKPTGTVPDEMVKRWLDDRIPLIRKAAEKEPFWRKCKHEFEFWTTGELSTKARAMIEVASNKSRKYKITVVDRVELTRQVKATSNPALKRTLQEHFLDHPLGKAERASKKRNRRLPIPPSSRLHKREVPDKTLLNADNPDAHDEDK
ncbi:MAG: hypothetical protein ABFS08_10195 [Pseudomonadota bacterium]